MYCMYIVHADLIIVFVLVQNGIHGTLGPEAETVDDIIFLDLLLTEDLYVHLNTAVS